MSFMLLKVRTVAVVTGSTIRMAASLVRLKKADGLLSWAERTCWKKLLWLLCCTSTTLQKSFHSDSVSPRQNL